MENLTVKELRVKAKALKIKGIYDMRKAELISAIEQAEKATKVTSESVTEEQTENAVAINGHYMPVREYNGERVVTFKDIDTAHERPDGTAKRNFNNNKKHFIEGVDFFKVCANEIRTHKIMNISSKAHEDILLFTETGYYMLVKSFTDELSWTVQRELVNNYFRVKKESAQPAVQYTDPKIIKNIELMCDAFMSGFNTLSRKIDMLECHQKQLEIKKTKKQFIPPTVQEVEEYCDYLGEWIDAERFVDYYESVGWTIGNGKPMKDWKASVRCWLKYE